MDSGEDWKAHEDGLRDLKSISEPVDKERDLERTDFEEETSSDCMDRIEAYCPYCHKFDYAAACEMDDGDGRETICCHCERVFWVEVQVVRNVTTYKWKERP